MRAIGELRQLVFAAVAAGMAQAAPLRAAVETVFAKDETLRAVWQAGDARFERIVQVIGVLLAHAERYRCSECGFSGRSFYWHCPACQSWETFETYAVVKLR
jgi:lipopolysaccharide assembly protein B